MGSLLRGEPLRATPEQLKRLAEAALRLELELLQNPRVAVHDPVVRKALGLPPLPPATLRDVHGAALTAAMLTALTAPPQLTPLQTRAIALLASASGRPVTARQLATAGGPCHRSLATSLGQARLRLAMHGFLPPWRRRGLEYVMTTADARATVRAMREAREVITLG